jgi:hypothetical protein
MPFLSRKDIPVEQTRTFDKKYRADLRQALQNPSLSEDQKEALQKEIARITISAESRGGRA